MSNGETAGLQFVSGSHSVELRPRFSLIVAEAAGFNFCYRVVFTFHRRTRDPAQHGDLAHVRQRVGDWSLKEALATCGQIRTRSQVIIKTLER